MKPRYHNVPVLDATWQRLRDYRVSGQTYDDVLNRLMDRVPIEDIAATLLAMHHRREKREIRPDLGEA